MLTTMRAWIEIPYEWGWGPVRMLTTALERDGYIVAEVRGTEVTLRLSGAKLVPGELLRPPGSLPVGGAG